MRHTAFSGVPQHVSSVRKPSVRSFRRATAFVLVAILFCDGTARGDGSGDPTAVKQEDGKFYDKEGNPTYSIKQDGTVDWYTYSGFIRYHSECHVCHGPDGLGSSYAPALTDSLKTMSYSDFLGVVASGRKDVNTANDKVMPAFGANKNVMCVIDDIYVYLRARSNNALGRGRPEKHADKPDAAAKWQASCFGPE
jgi:methanol metabolism-related c-type cytochrome